MTLYVIIIGSPALKLTDIVNEFNKNKEIIIFCYRKKYLLELNKKNNLIFADEIIELISDYLI